MKPYRKHVLVCSSSDCAQYGAEDILDLLGQGLRERGLQQEIKLTKTGCLKECEDGPIVIVYPDGVWYSRVAIEDVDDIIDEHLVNERVLSRLLHHRMN
ncbi:MAG: (2Fe-2S) ferredoxin domain-containing protein [Chloroflexi bacterium]|nr:(2Fe-2S) ferredoxin domain-containing protein [Chloroflexota bacterium]MDA8189054.1 (2Fe-2S) ferredoxin domain-containing protein [Dehalococcoidales bacterium]